MASVLSTTRESQRPNGLIPKIAPDYTQGEGIYLDAPSWGHSIIQAPYHLYKAFGDVQTLRDNYSAAKKYYAYLKSKAVNRLVTHGLGDWVSPSGTHVSNNEGAVYANAAATLAAIASVLDAQSDVEYYTQELEYTKKAYNSAYLSADNCSYTPSVQANQAVPFAYDFLPDELTKCAGEALVDIIHNPVHSNSTGFGDILPDHIATGENALLPLINALHKINRDDLTEKMISQLSRPSFRGLVLADQSTLPEQWNYGSARSLNHDMFATIMEWFYTSVGGIAEVTPGFKVFKLQPSFNLELKDANVSYESIRGLISSSWAKESIGSSKWKIHWSVRIPSDSEAEVYFPGRNVSVSVAGKGLRNDTDGVLDWPVPHANIWGDWTTGRFTTGSYTFEFEYEN